jgi:predicted transcriptional regulator of viral defense system
LSCGDAEAPTPQDAATRRFNPSLANTKVQDIFSFMPTSIDTLYTTAEAQAGYFTAAQARGLGISHQQLYYLSRTGSIERAAHGIYRLTRFPGQPFEDVMVATLWAGRESVASHDTALAVYGLTDAMPAVIHITVPRRFRGKMKGVEVHIAPLQPGERGVRDGVPVTSPSRTIQDIAARYGADAATEAAEQALSRGIVTRDRLTRELAPSRERSDVLRKLGLAT